MIGLRKDFLVILAPTQWIKLANIDIHIADILILISLFQGFIFGFAVMFSRFFKGTANRYLAYSIGIISIIGLDELFTKWDLDEVYYAIDYFGDDVPWILLYYVPLFLYFLKSINHPFGNSPLNNLLYAPFAIFVGLNLFINFDVDFHFYTIPHFTYVQKIIYETEYYLALSYSLCLAALSYVLIRKSNMQGDEKNWLLKLWVFTSVLIICWLLLVLWAGYFELSDSVLNYALWVGISFFIYWLSYKGMYEFKLSQDQLALKQLLLWGERPHERDIVPPKKPMNQKPLHFTKENQYFQKIEQLFQAEHLYRNPHLGRDFVAGKLGISSGYLSQIINAATGNNFSTYVNAYRVAEAKRLIQDPTSNALAYWQ